jgi:hypothetical protein
MYRAGLSVLGLPALPTEGLIMAQPFFVQFLPGPTAAEVMRRPDAFVLLAQIAPRARRRGSSALDSLQPGEALIGDYRSIGLTPRRYRTAKATLERGKLATFQATNRGTVATLASDTVFRVLGINADEPERAEATDQRPAGDKPATSSRKIKGESRKRKEEGAAAPLDVFSALLTQEEFRRLDVPELRQAYADWCGHRSESKKPQTSKAVELDALNMVKVLDAGGNAAEIVTRIQKAISAGWRGWYFPEQAGQAAGPGRNVEDAAERYRKTSTGG